MQPTVHNNNLNRIAKEYSMYEEYIYEICDKLDFPKKGWNIKMKR